VSKDEPSASKRGLPNEHHAGQAHVQLVRIFRSQVAQHGEINTSSPEFLVLISTITAEQLITRLRRSVAVPSSEGEVSGQFELKTIRRSFQTTAGRLIVNDEEITVGTIDVT